MVIGGVGICELVGVDGIAVAGDVVAGREDVFWQAARRHRSSSIAATYRIDFMVVFSPLGQQLTGTQTDL
jgi:hypothetical protein